MSDGNQTLVKQSLNGNAGDQPQTAPGSTPQQKELISDISLADAKNIQQVAASNLNLSDKYCQSIIRQANRSFWSALISASVGLVVFLAGTAFLLVTKQDAVQMAVITGLGTAITAFVSGTSFYLYTQAMRHFEAFHLCLARTEVVLLENSICQQIEDQAKRDEAYAGIVGNIEHLAILITSYGQQSQQTTNTKDNGLA
jgi:hypothetical protein